MSTPSSASIAKVPVPRAGHHGNCEARRGQCRQHGAQIIGLLRDRRLPVRETGDVLLGSAIILHAAQRQPGLGDRLRQRDRGLGRSHAGAVLARIDVDENGRPQPASARTMSG